MIGLEFLQKIGEVLQKSLSSEETYSAVFDILDSVVEFDAATLFIVNPATQVLEVVESRGAQVVDLVSDVSFNRGGGLSGWVASQREPVILPAISGETAKRSYRSLVSIPLWYADRLEGVLNLGHQKQGYYRQEDKPDLARLGTQLSLIVEQLRLRCEIQEKNRLLENTLQELQTTQTALVEKERLAAIGELTVALNHEINNPLAIIISFVDIMTGKCKTGFPEVVEPLAKVKEAAVRIQEVTRKLEHIRTSEVQEYVEGVKMLKLG